MKRSLISTPRRSKRLCSAPKPDPVKKIDDWPNWVAPTKLKNYFLKDGFLDWANANAPLQNVKSDGCKTDCCKTDVNFLFQRGLDFEDHVLKLLRSKIGAKNILDIGCRNGCKDDEKYRQTVEAIGNRIPVIYSGVVRDYETKTWGIPDLIVRTDFLNKIVNTEVDDSDGDDNYRIIDIKYQTLFLRADGIHMLNRAMVTAYKAQVYVYTMGLNVILDHFDMAKSTSGYILGRKWRYTTQGKTFAGKSCFGRLGKIDYADTDKDTVVQTPKALEWIRSCRENYKNWDMTKYPLARKELYPNMCNTYDYPYHNMKEDYAKNMSDITLLWMCGPKQRDIAISKNKFTIDQLDSSADMGFKKTSVCGPILDIMLKVNKDPTITVYPNAIAKDRDIWASPDTVEFYVDFETVNDAFFPLKGEKVVSVPKIFMIGVGAYMPATGKWFYANFTVDKLTFAEERKICEQFLRFVLEAKNRMSCKKVVMYHWSPAEPSTFDDFLTRDDKLDIEEIIDRPDFIWYDVCKLFKKEPVIVSGVYGFGLKNIAKKLKELGHVDTLWGNDDACKSGIDAMIQAVQAAQISENTGVSMVSLPMVKDIIHYNEIDCKVVQEIVTFLRNTR